ncbi:MAG TPA: hypothetical protein VFO76_10970, partial [Candidatus Kapabacteria bacterium]|nr:hypothetical protein [Candidatus Kapabacteria bacterium]
ISGLPLADTIVVGVVIRFGLSENLDSTYLGTSYLHYAINSPGATFTKNGSDIIFAYDNFAVCASEFSWMQHGTIIYLKAYGSMFNAYYNRYYDVLSDKWISPNPLPMSNTLSVVIP